MNAPAGRIEVPTDVDTVTYATRDSPATVKVFDQYGIRFLTADEIHAEMPRSYTSLDSHGGGTA